MGGCGRSRRLPRRGRPRRWRAGRRRGAGCSWNWLLIQVDDRGRKVSLLSKNGQRQRCEHKDERRDDGKLAQKIRGPSAAEDGLAGAAECRADFGPFSRLQQDRSNHEQANNHVDDDQQGIHVEIRPWKVGT